MKLDKYVDRHITETLRAKNEEHEKGYTSKGNLSASQLGWPLQWQILKSRGIKAPPPDDYTLRKFSRGNHVEEWFISMMPDVVDTQQKVAYKGVTGRLDCTVNTLGWDFNVGTIPVEVKSVTNAKFRRIVQRKETDRGHLLQGGLYALALGAPHFAIAYIASDDYRIRVHIHTVKEVQPTIDGIIKRFENQVALGTIPVFSPEEDWQENIKYNMYPEWASLTEDEITSKLKDYEL